MKHDEIRQETIELIARIQPKLQEGVFSPDQFRVHFETPYRARSLQKLQAYESAHKKIFCRQCIHKHPKKSFLLCYQLWVEESDNLMDNKPGEWVSAQCMNEDCDFDLITPRPSPTKNSMEEHQRQLMELIKQYPQDPVWNQQALQEFYNKSWQQQQAAQMRQAALQQGYTSNSTSIQRNFHDHELDALRYAQMGKAGALSSAGTLGSNPQPKRKKK